MKILESIMRDTHFVHRCAFFANGTFIGEDHANFVRQSLGRDLAISYGLTAVLLSSGALGLIFKDTPGMIVISRHAVDWSENTQLFRALGSGHAALYTEWSEEVSDAMGNYMRGIDNQRTKENTTLLH
jgi:hypothetical protein